MTENGPDKTDPLLDAGLNAQELDGLFAAARQAAPVPSADVLARILADADAVADARPAPAIAAPRRTESFVSRALQALGGWPSIAGLATAAVAGVAIGVASPDVVALWSGGILGSETADVMGQLMPSFDGILGEG